MQLINVIQFISFSLSLFAIGAWAIKLRRWPLLYAVLVSMLTNIIFYICRVFNILSASDLNLFSSVRVLLFVIIIAAIPFAVHEA